jgi:hypothetical protein
MANLGWQISYAIMLITVAIIVIYPLPAQTTFNYGDAIVIDKPVIDGIPRVVFIDNGHEYTRQATPAVYNAAQIGTSYWMMTDNGVITQLEVDYDEGV